ncbi:uncharacterized protein [Antennarius striatus]|uniref:uncharacterized protein n=1 Tax=Antennarius striatus TaxID=241820 RepID=UPI0035AFFB86
MAAKAIPSQRQGNNNKQTTTQEVECTPATPDKSPLKKRKPSCEPTLKSADLFEVTTTAARKDICSLMTTLSNLLRERAVADTSQIKELEGILVGAANVESHLKEKKEYLRQTLSVISDKLQG